MVDLFYIVYLDNILIFLNLEEKHVEHIREVLKRLRKAKLFIKLSKWKQFKQEIKSLGYTVLLEGDKVDINRVKTI